MINQRGSSLVLIMIKIIEQFVCVNIANLIIVLKIQLSILCMFVKESYLQFYESRLSPVCGSYIRVIIATNKIKDETL